MTNNDITSRQHIMSPEALAVLGDGKIAYLKTIRSEDVQRQFPQAQLAPGVEVHATKGLSAVGQIQWPVDFATGKGAPPSVGLGVVGHF